MKVKFFGVLADHFDELDLDVNNIQVALSGVAHHYPTFRKTAQFYDARCKLESDVLYVIPKTDGAWVQVAIQVIGAISSIYGAAVAIQQKRIQKQNKKALSQEAEGSLFEGIINTDTQGGAIPLGFGEVYGGSVVINNELEPYSD